MSMHAAEGPCLNCGAWPAGPWCQDCGQRAGPAHRSTIHLLHELVELLTHADGRIWRTVRALLFQPARLTTGFLLGQRARQIPPLRLFFVILLVLFTAGSLVSRGLVVGDIPAANRAQITKAIDEINTHHPRVDAWLKPHLHHAAANPREVVEVMREWLERLTLLMLPIAAGLLWILTITVRPRFSYFDHLVFAMHSLSFAGLAQIGVFLAGMIVPGAGLLLLLPIVHLFFHMRGVYGGGVIVTLARMFLLGFGSLMAVVALLVALAGIGLQFGAAG